MTNLFYKIEKTFLGTIVDVKLVIEQESFELISVTS